MAASGAADVGSNPTGTISIFIPSIGIVTMLPRIKKMEFRNVHIDEEIYKDNDLFLFQHGVETTETSHKTTMKDFEKMLLREPAVVIFGTGFKSMAQIDNKIHEIAKKNNIEVHTLSTPEAAKKFQELSRKGKKVVAKLHVTC